MLLRKKRNNSRILFIVLSFLFLFENSFAQHFHRKCGSQILDSIQRANNPHYDTERKNLEERIQNIIKKQRRNRTSAEELIYTVPVVFHIIYNENQPISNVPEEEVLEQLDVLNEDFRRLNSDTTLTPAIYADLAADTKIQFCMATRDPEGNEIEQAIVRVPTSREYFEFTSADNIALKSLSHWPSDQYLNIWVAQLAPNNVLDVIGYAQFPTAAGIQGLNDNFEPGESKSTDGVVVDYRVFGVNQPASNITPSAYVLGRTLTHEVGHWLGLIHIFGDFGGCGSSTDYVADTPEQGDDNQNLNDCNAIIPGCQFEAMYQNYMDYTDDACMNLFTKGQKERMRAVLLASPLRAEILNSPGCCGVGVSSVTPPYTQTFEDEIPSLFWDDSTFSSTMKWVSEPGIEGNSASLTNSGTNTSSIISPFVDYSLTETPAIEFQTSTTSPTSNVTLSYELTCSDTWIEIINIPSAQNWGNHFILLPQLSGNKFVRFRVEGNTDKGSIQFDNFLTYKYSSELSSELYPNPATNQSTLEVNHPGFDTIKIQIYTLLGQLAQEIETEPVNSSTFSLFFGDSPSGVYIIRAEVNGETISHKLIITE